MAKITGTIRRLLFSTPSETVRSLGLLILRLGTGGLMVFGHGWGKLSNFSEGAANFGDPIGLGPTVSFALVVFAEFFCGIALAFGLLTRLALVPLVVAMAVAAFVHHAQDPLFVATSGMPAKEFALLYLIPFLALFFTGPGRYSVDGLLGRGSGRP